MIMSPPISAGLVCLAVLVFAGCTSNPISETAPGLSLLETAQRAEDAYQGARYTEAAVLYEELARAMPSEAAYWYRLGNSYARSERPGDAVFAYQQSLAVDARNARAWHNLGVILLRQSQEAFIRGTHAATEESVEKAQNQRMVDLLRQITGDEVYDGLDNPPSAQTRTPSTSE